MSEKLNPGAQRILEVLRRNQLTRAELAIRTGLTAHSLTTKDYLPKLLRLRRIHITGWMRIPQHIIPVYALGDKPNVPKILALPGKTRSQQYYERHTERVLLAKKFSKAKIGKRCMFKMVKDKRLMVFKVFDQVIGSQQEELAA